MLCWCCLNNLTTSIPVELFLLFFIFCFLFNAARLLPDHWSVGLPTAWQTKPRFLAWPEHQARICNPSLGFACHSSPCTHLSSLRLEYFILHTSMCIRPHTHCSLPFLRLFFLVDPLFLSSLRGEIVSNRLVWLHGLARPLGPEASAHPGGVIGGS